MPLPALEPASTTLPLPPLATVAEVAAHLAISRSKLYQLMDRGGLPYVQLGRCRRIRWADVSTCLNEHRIGPT